MGEAGSFSFRAARVVGLEIYGFTAGPFQTNTYVIAEGRRAFIVDPGIRRDA